MYVLGGPKEKTVANGWWLPGDRIWKPHREEGSRSQGGNGLPRKALSFLSLEIGKQRQDSQWAMERILAVDGSWPPGTGFHQILGLQ